MTGPDNTSVDALIRASEIGYDAGLRIRLRGQPAGPRGQVREHILPRLQSHSVERYGFHVLKNRMRAGDARTVAAHPGPLGGPP